MRGLLFADNTVPFPVAAICDLVNRTCDTFRLSPGRSPVRIRASAIMADKISGLLGSAVQTEAKAYDYAFVCTSVPYDNNFFFDSDGELVVLSFSGWNLLTDLPITNGFLYFVASILCDLRGDDAHQENTGCVNDYLWDKRGIDVGMRAAFVCAACKGRLGGDGALLVDAERLLDLVSAASRNGRDVLTLSASNARGLSAGFDVFLCHNSDDKSAVREVNRFLQRKGLRTWFDEEQLQPGRMWQPELERQIGEVRAACVFVGPNGRGPWQDMEIRAFLNEFLSRGCPVVPVLLKDAGPAPDLPLFLRQMVWVDLRTNPERHLKRLVTALMPRPAPSDR